MTCDKCGAELRIGEWPWCPHGDARYFGEEPLEPGCGELLVRAAVILLNALKP